MHHGLYRRHHHHRRCRSGCGGRADSEMEGGSRLNEFSSSSARELVLRQLDTYVLSSILIPSRDGELGPETLRGAPSRYHEPNEVLAVAIDFAECLSLGRPSRSIVIYYLGNGGGRRALSLGHRRRCINQA